MYNKRKTVVFLYIYYEYALQSTAQQALTYKYFTKENRKQAYLCVPAITIARREGDRETTGSSGVAVGVCSLVAGTSPQNTAQNDFIFLWWTLTA